MPRKLHVFQEQAALKIEPGAEEVVRVVPPAPEKAPESVKKEVMGDEFEMSAEELSTFEEGTRRIELQNDLERNNRIAGAEVARVRSHLITNQIERGGLEDDKAWEMIHELRSYELELEAGIEAAWERPSEYRMLPEAIEERQEMAEALDSVQKAVRILGEHVKLIQGREQALTQALAAIPDAAPEQTVAELSPEEIRRRGDEVEAIRLKAFEAHEDDLSRIRDIEHMLREDNMPLDQQISYASFFAERIQALEQDVKKYDSLSDEEFLKPENASAHEAANYVLNESRRMAAILRKEATESERISMMSDAVQKLIGNVKDMYAGDAMTEEWHLQALTELSKAYADIEDRLRSLQGMDAPTEESKTEMKRLAETLQHIDEARDELHTKAYKEEAAPAGEAVEKKESVQQRAAESGRRKLRAVLRAKERDLEEMKIEERELAQKVEKFYGQSPDVMIAKGGIGMRGLLKRLFAIGAGEDSLKDWRDLTTKIENLKGELKGGSLTYPSTISGEAKMAVRAKTDETKVEEEEARAAAATYREAVGKETPSTAEEMEQEYLEPTAEPSYSRETREILERAVDAGLDDAPEIYVNIAGNLSSELLGFKADEYINQLRLRVDALAERRSAKKRGPRAVKASERRYEAVKNVLKVMQDELNEMGIDPKTGQPTRGIGRIRPISMPKRRDVGPTISGGVSV